jgi:hypothetical protein
MAFAEVGPSDRKADYGLRVKQPGEWGLTPARLGPRWNAGVGIAVHL